VGDRDRVCVCVCVCVVSAKDLTHRVCGLLTTGEDNECMGTISGAPPEDAEAVHGAVFDWM
jgi:hypothetical protein